jgi:hypothetical protein
LEEIETFDAVFSDSPEVVLLRYIRQRRGLSPIPWLVNEVDQFSTAEVVRRYIIARYGEDPLPEALWAHEVLWFSITPGLRPTYRRLGLRVSNLHYLPLARSSIAFFFPNLVDLQNRFLRNPGRKREAPVPEGCILAIGSHERDYDCLARALRPTGLTAEIICNLHQYPKRPAGPLRWHNSQPPEVYLECLRRADVVVVPLRDDGRALGQLSCALPMRMGKAIVATAVPSLSAHLIPGKTGLGYPAGDAQALRRCLLELVDHPERAKTIGRAARRKEASLSRTANRMLERILDRLRILAGVTQPDRRSAR